MRETDDSKRQVFTGNIIYSEAFVQRYDKQLDSKLVFSNKKYNHECITKYKSICKVNRLFGASQTSAFGGDFGGGLEGFSDQGNFEVLFFMESEVGYTDKNPQSIPV